MKATGYQIREALRRQGLRRDASAALFDDSLTAFADDQKTHPTNIVENFKRADRAIAALQVAQDQYNLHMKVKVTEGDGTARTITLAEAVKLVGGAGRIEKMWRSAANPKKEHYRYQEEVRKDGEVRAAPVMKVAALLDEADRAARWAGSLRQAIAVANTQEVELALEGLSEALAG
jgi:hypothetical protein